MDEDYPRTVLELERRFADVGACRQYLGGLRWPEGFICPRCSGKTAWPMRRGLWLCRGCRQQVSVTAGTIFQDSHLPLTTWFRAMWHVGEPEERGERLGAAMGTGAWQLQDRLDHAPQAAAGHGPPGTRPAAGNRRGGRNILGQRGSRRHRRLTETKALIAVAAEEDGAGIGRVRLRRIPDLTKSTLHGFIVQAIEPGSTVRTDGLNAYRGLEGYVHDRQVQRRQTEGEHLLPRVHHAYAFSSS